MAVTENTYTGNGSTVLYSFTFPYLETTDIKVSLNGNITTAYTLANATTVQFNSAPGNGVAIRIYRETDDANLAAQFYPGSAIRSQDLNDNFLQSLYVSQEAKAITVNASSGNLADGSVTSDKIASLAVSEAKIANGAVTPSKLAETYLTTAAASSTYQTQGGMSSYLAKAGGTMTGDINFVSSQTYPKVPANSQTGAYTLVASDAGKHISITTGGITVPSGVFSVGDVVSIYNNSTSSQTITQGGSVTLRQAGTANTGNRTLVQHGVCTLLCVASNTFVISGAGLS